MRENSGDKIHMSENEDFSWREIRNSFRWTHCTILAQNFSLITYSFDVDYKKREYNSPFSKLSNEKWTNTTLKAFWFLIIQILLTKWQKINAKMHFSKKWAHKLDKYHIQQNWREKPNTVIFLKINKIN